MTSFALSLIGTRIRSLGLAGLLVVTLLSTTSARADGLEATLVVMELRVRGQEQPKTAEYVRRLSAQLGDSGRFALLERADAKRLLVGKMASPPRRVTESRLQSIEALMAQGDELTYTDPQQAIRILAEAKSALLEVLEGAHLNRKIREDFFRTQMLLARSHFDNGNTNKVREILTEIVRDFDAENAVTDEDYHPDIVAMFHEVRSVMEARKVGKLLVRTSREGAEVYIGGRPQKLKSPSTYGSLYPGETTVSARIDGRDSLLHKVTVSLDRVAEVDIDIDFESSVAISEDSFGLVLQEADAVAGMVGGYSQQVGELVDVEYVLAAGLVDREGSTFLEGYLVDVAGARVVRRLSLLTKRNVVSKSRVAELREHMVGFVRPGESMADKIMQPIVGWIGLGGGLALTAAGVGMLSKFNELKEIAECAPDPDPDKNTCQSAPERQIAKNDGQTFQGAGMTFLVLGGAAAIGGATIVVLTMLRGSDQTAEVSPGLRLEALMPYALPTGGGLSAGFSF